MPLYRETISGLSMFIRPINRPALPLLFMIAAAAISCASVTACKSAPPKPEAIATAPKVDKNPDEPTKDLPSDLLPAMPIFPGATVEHVHKPKGAMREITFSTSAQLNQVVDFYKEELKKNSFHITSSLIMPARKTWSCDFHKGGRPATIMLYPDDHDKSKMVIDLIYELPPKADASLQEAEETFDVVGPGEVAQQAPNSNPKTKRN
jgi:hypothetical protein